MRIAIDRHATDRPRAAKGKKVGAVSERVKTKASTGRPPKTAKATKPVKSSKSRELALVSDVEDVVEAVKPARVKKKTTGTALAKLNKQTALLKKASTTFGLPAKQLYAMIQEGQTDQAIIMFQRQMMATILRLIPIAEKQYRREKKEHTAYALNSLVSQARELAADIQSSADRAQVAEIIVNDMMMPTFRSFIETLVFETQTLKAALVSKTQPRFRTEVDLMVDTLVRQVATNGNELFRANANAIRDILGAPKKRGVSR